VSDSAPRRRFAPGTTPDDLKAYMAPFVARLGYKFNTDEDFVAMVMEGEIEVLERDGDVYCPCRVRTGDPKEDLKIICPCIAFYTDQFSAMRKCWCGLFIRTDVEDGSLLHGVMEAPAGEADVRIAATGDLADGQGRVVAVGKRKLALFRVDGEFFCLDNVCMHMWAPLGEGYLDGHTVMCPWHGWRYDVRTGTTDHPDADVKTHLVTVRDGEVFVRI
jgi:nitrite reductase/ring-hydroxylating ferredoxin subunit/ferredoxin-thioredoxin reductase catalytic subunit